jgi:hypothetical protein
MKEEEGNGHTKHYDDVARQQRPRDGNVTE